MVVVKTLLFFQLCVFFALACVVAVSLASPEDPDCGLNFTSSPYKPSGECIAADQENINEWDSFPTTRCCQNVLNFFSQALAKQAITQQGNLFLQQHQWEHCSGPFKHQPSVSIENCGFGSLYQRSSKCSSLSLTNVLQDDNFNDVRDKCTGFGSSFDDACRNCAGAIKSARDQLLDQFYARDNDTERATCVMAVVISVATTKLNDPSSMDDFFSCLPALNFLEKSSEDYIKIKWKDKVLTWEQRVNILRDCALALRYLHNYIDGCIVHRDIKLTNILLTEDLQPKLSDFGLARMLGMEESKVFTDVRGTIGYMDPEYMSNAKLTCASDIYSFGIVVLQVLSGQKVIELDLDARDQLTRKAKDVSMAKRPQKDFEDPRLKGQLNSVDFESILQIAVLCVAKSSKGRPTIDVVLEEMDKVWKNTLSDKKAAEQSAIAAVRRSHSVGVIPV